MALTLEQLETETLKRSIDERARLAHKLLLSLDEVNEVENEGLWKAEAQRRYQELLHGKDQGQPAVEVFNRIRTSLA